MSSFVLIINVYDGVVVSFMMVNKSLILHALNDLLYIRFSFTDHVLRVLDSSTPSYRRINRIQAKDVGYVMKDKFSKIRTPEHEQSNFMQCADFD